MKTIQPTAALRGIHLPSPTSTPSQFLPHHHYITISKQRVQSKTSLSRMGAREAQLGRRRGRGRGRRGQDRGSKSRPKTELLSSLCVHVGVRTCVRACLCTSACRKKCASVSKGEKEQKVCGRYLSSAGGSSTTALQSLHIPEAQNGACRGSGGAAQEECRSR